MAWSKKISIKHIQNKRNDFYTSNRKLTHPNLKVNNINIERVTQFNFLDVMFNLHMVWSRHINCISMKVSNSIGILYQLKKYISPVCSSYIIQYFDLTTISLLYYYGDPQ